jgi:hypothetical protein
MPRRMILSLIFPTAGAACLLVGFLSAGRWPALPVGLVTFCVWLAACRWRSGFLPVAALALSVGSAAAGLILFVPPVWMMLAAGCALAGWDMILLQDDLADAASADTARRLEARHYRSLIPALVIGLAAAVAGPLIRIQIPFGWMMILAALVLTGLEGIRRSLGGKDPLYR